MHAASRVVFAIRLNDLATAVDWGNRLSQYSDDITDVWFQHVPSRLMIAKGDKVAAAERLQALYEKVAQADAQSLVIVTRVCQALAATEPAQALAFLADALKLGEPEGFIRTFVDEGRLLGPLLHQALEGGITPDYTARLIRIIEDEGRPRGGGGLERAPSVTTSGPLTERELEVLRLLAAGLANRQIAVRLVVTAGTVKVHVHNLMEKLKARNRTQAVAKGRELGLI